MTVLRSSFRPFLRVSGSSIGRYSTDGNGNDKNYPHHQHIPYHPPDDLKGVPIRSKLGRHEADPVNDIPSVSKDDAKIPQAPEPWSCCGSGCQDCVWIEYALAVSKFIDEHCGSSELQENRSKTIRDTLKKNISDENLRMFLEIELRARKI